MTLTAERPVACACDHCNCQFDPSAGHTHEGKLYCSEACATHDHHHPSDCCVASHCCQ